jgi:hypothetical protein
MKFVCILLFYKAVHYSSAFPNTLCSLVYFLVYFAVLVVFLCIHFLVSLLFCS